MFKPEVLQAQHPDVTPQPEQIHASSSTMTSTPDPRVLDALGRLAKSEAWLEDHNEGHPQWFLALAKQMSIIGELTELELQGAEIPW
jgi:hypothetical protein